MSDFASQVGEKGNLVFSDMQAREALTRALRHIVDSSKLPRGVKSRSYSRTVSNATINTARLFLLTYGVDAMGADRILQERGSLNRRFVAESGLRPYRYPGPWRSAEEMLTDCRDKFVSGNDAILEAMREFARQQIDCAIWEPSDE